MRKMSEFLGLVERTDYDDFDYEETGEIAVRETEIPAERRAAVRPVADLDERRTRAPRPVAEVRPQPRSGVAGSMLNRIETVTPRTYNDARTVGEHYRSGVPVIMNLSEITDDDAKRLVDFAAGLVFGVHGSITRVTGKVFLLSPEDIQVTDEDRQRIAAGGFFDQR